MEAYLSNPVRYLKGIGPKKAKLFQRLGIKTVEDLLYYFPRGYQDRRFFTPIASLKEGVPATIKGEVLGTGLIRTRTGKKLFRLVVGDGTGQIACTWFNQPYLKDNFQKDEAVIFSGKASRYGSLQLVNPEYEKLTGREEDLIHTGRIVPLYPLTAGINQKTMRAAIKNALEESAPHLQDMLPSSLRQKWQVIPLGQALENIHYLSDYKFLPEARKRLILDEFFLLQLAFAVKKERFSSSMVAPRHKIESSLLQKFIRSLPFRLTRAQERVVGEIVNDMTSSRPMNRLLQGDVGSGKTVVAVCSLLNTVGNGFQGAIMAPTEILAQQHYRNLVDLLQPLDIKIALLTGALQGTEKKNLLKSIRSGKVELVVGTQALIQEKVGFHRLGMVVIDEQHKFGVIERAKLRRKGRSPHVLVMTATPIPRTLILTIYGDLEVSVLDEMPPGREKVRTYWIGPEKLEQAYAFIHRQAKKGRQAFIIYPLVEESDLLKAKAATKMFDYLRYQVFSDLKLDLIHGRMKASEKERIMRNFRDQNIQVLVSTVVVEIGIDIPNAAVMLVENAERFGLAQLHQLRGRVGRGRHRSYCILQGNPGTEQGKRRLRAMRDIDDGFVIAQEDLGIRGPGEFFGTHQHGLPEIRIGSIVADYKLMEFARRQAFRMIENDKNLADPKYGLIREKLISRYGGRLELGLVG